MSAETPAYGLWLLAIVNAAIFILFAFSFARPRSGRDWRSFGAFAAFIVALFTEMYGFPLTIYLLSGWLGSRYPALDPLSHDAGHLLWTFLGMKGDPHLNFLHLLSGVVIAGGFILIMAGFLLQWPTLPTVVMFPILVAVYVRLARREEREALVRFGDEYRRYMARVPGFLPSLRSHRLERPS